MKRLKSLPVLMYHHVSPNAGLVTISPECFAAQMLALKKAGYQTLSTLDLENFFKGETLPPKSVLITFDDGYLDNRVFAYPVLKALKMRAVIFVVTDWIKNGNKRPFAKFENFKTFTVENCPKTPEHNACKAEIAQGRADSVILNLSELLAMQDVFEYHPHTHTHQRFDQIFANNVAQKRTELFKDLNACQAFFLQNFGQKSTHLCWPQGYFDDDYVEIATQAGFQFLYTTKPGANRINHSPRRIHRFVTKEKSGQWLKHRAWLYSVPWLADFYAKGK